MTSHLPGTVFEGGFTDAPLDAATAFRAVLEALSRPGTLATLTGATPPAPLSQAAGVLVLTLFDATTPVHLAGGHDTPALRDWLVFHTGAPLVGAEQAAFAIGSWDALQPVTRFAPGTPDYPDRAATLIIEMPELAAQGALLRGPGIKETARLFDRQRGQIRIIERALGHHPVNRQRKLLADLVNAQLSHRGVAAPLFGEKGMGIVDGLLATLDGNIHQPASTCVERGNPATRSPLVRKVSKPSG